MKNSDKNRNNNFQILEAFDNFNFPVACNDIKINSSENKLLATGIYKPSIKLFDFNEMNLKYERHSVEEIKKLCFIENLKFSALRNTKVEFHTKNGLYETIKLKSAGNDLEYFNKNLYISSKNLIIFNLEQGKFIEENIGIKNIISVKISKTTGLMSILTEKNINFFDIRDMSFIFKENLKNIYCSDFNEENYSVGTEKYFIEFDLKNKKNISKIQKKTTKIKYKEKNKIILTEEKGKSTLFINNTKNEYKFNYRVNALENEKGVIILGGETENMEILYNSILGEIPQWISK